MLQLCIYAGAQQLLQEAVRSVHLPGSEGEFEVMDFHIPFVACLTSGKVRWKLNRSPFDKLRANGDGILPIVGGLAWFTGNRLVVLAEG